MHCYRAGEPWWLEDPNVMHDAAEEQRGRYLVGTTVLHRRYLVGTVAVPRRSIIKDWCSMWFCSSRWLVTTRKPSATRTRMLRDMHDRSAGMMHSARAIHVGFVGDVSAYPGAEPGGLTRFRF